MAAITLIGPGHPCGNPRLVRDADVLAESGYDVRVLGVRFVPRLVPFDEELLRGRRWRYQSVDFLGSARHRLHWQFARARKWVCRALADRLAWPAVDRRAYLYATPELTRLALKEPADLYVAHQHSTLPAAAGAAARRRVPYAFDAEDLLADCPDEPEALVRRYERDYLPGCAYVTTMSEAAARRLGETTRLARPPLTLHNTPRLAEREGLVGPLDRPAAEPPSIYWFGQTLGPHSCAEQVVRALPLLARPARLVLRGNPREDYVRHLRELAGQLGVAPLLEIAPVAPPAEMVRLAGRHQVLLGSQPGRDLFHQMAIGNKVFTGMMAGLALALTDTIAHRRLLEDIPGAGFLYPEGDPAGLAAKLNPLLTDPALLRQTQHRSWLFAQDTYNWEKESQRLLGVVAEVFRGERRSAA